jgi:hypothetical protein
MPGMTRNHIEPRRVAHKSTGGMLHSIPEPVDPVGNAPPLTSNTVAHFSELWILPPVLARTLEISAEK